MTKDDADQFAWVLRALVDKYGPWDVLHNVAEVLRPEFVEQAKAEEDAKPKRQGRDARGRPAG